MQSLRTSSWHRWLQRMFRRTPNRNGTFTRKHRPPRRPVRLLLETLEDRITPANFIVNGVTTGPNGGLVGIIAQANTHPGTSYTIQLQPTTAPLGAYNLTSALTITNTAGVTIEAAPGVGNITIRQTGGAGNRIFTVAPGGNVTLDNLTLTGGTVNDGGAVHVSAGGHLTIENSIITGNTATGGAGTAGEGGGIFVAGGGTLNINDSTITNNTATGGAGAAGEGGGIAATGAGWTVRLTGDTLRSNRAVGGFPAAAGAVGSLAFGGGVFASGSGTLTILNDAAKPTQDPSIFFQNAATGGAGGAGAPGGNAFGGGLDVVNAAGDTTTVQIGNTAFYDNTATGGAPGAGSTSGNASGGGVALFLAGAGGVTMVNNTIAQNIAQGNVAAGTSPTGGGIFTTDATADTFINNTITLNSTESPGGGVAGTGGGMFIGTAPLTPPALTNNLMQGNAAATNADLHSGVILGSNATYNFVESVNPGAGVFVGPPFNNIVSNGAAQLGAVVGVNPGPPPALTGGPIYYPLANNTVASFGSGTTSVSGAYSVLGTISTVEGLTPPLDEAGNLRTTNGTGTGSIDLGAVQQVAPVVPAATAVVPGSVSVNFYGTAGSPAFTVPVSVNVPGGGVASGGTVSIYLNYNNNLTLLGTAVVGAIGSAAVNVAAGALPPNLQPGTYTLVENYSGNSNFNASTANGTLTITTAPTSVVAGNATLNYYGSSSPAFTLTVGVNSPAGTVNTGNVDVKLVSDDTTTDLGMAALSPNGTATINVGASTLPANLQVGSYQLIETYTDVGGPFAGSTGTGTLTITTAPTSVVAGNAMITVGTTGPVMIPVAVNSPDGVVSGNVVITLIAGDTSYTLTPAGGVPLSGGQASVSVTLPSGLGIGTYRLVETYLGNGQFAGSSAVGTLTVDPVPVPVAALKTAIDATAIALLADPNFPALMELELFTNVFLHTSFPLSIPALIEDIQFLYPQTNGLGLAAIAEGMFLANDLMIENPQ